MHQRLGPDLRQLSPGLYMWASAPGPGLPSLLTQHECRHLVDAVDWWPPPPAFFFFLVFLGLHVWHKEVPRLRVKTELQLPA